jgi:hypothetical protein
MRVSPASRGRRTRGRWDASAQHAMIVISLIATVLPASLLVVMVAAGVCHLVDRRALRRGDPAAFARGYRILALDSDLILRSRRPQGLLSTAEGEGKWLNEEVFAFWQRADYGHTSQFKWIGRAIARPQGVRFEVRAMRSTMLRSAAVLVVGVAFLVITPFMGLSGVLMAIAMAVFIAWTLWTPFAREREIAGRVVNQLRIRLEHADDDEW